MQKLFELNNNSLNNKKDQKDSARTRNKASFSGQSGQNPPNNQNNVIKCFMHQPIVNNFISISQDQPIMKIKTSIKEERNKILSSKQRNKSNIEKKNFSYKYIIEKGGFGKVWKVEHTKTRNLFAMK